MDNTSLSLLASVSNLQEDFIVIFEDKDVIYTNNSFNRFFNVSSTKEYNENFGEFVNNFVPHPSYFQKNKVAENEYWIDAVVKLDEDERVVSMLSQTYEPLAFSVNIDQSVNGYSVVVFKDITQDLIKRIMIQNNANIDKNSGAYSKKYFQEIAKSYQEAAVFNEKIVAILSITITQDDSVVHKDFVEQFLVNIRQEDMLVRWSENTYLLVYMVEDIDCANKVLEKFQTITKIEPLDKYGCIIKINVQNENENIKTFIKRV